MTGSHRASAGIARCQHPAVATIRAQPPLTFRSPGGESSLLDD